MNESFLKEIPLTEILDKSCIIANMKSTTKSEAIDELLAVLSKAELLPDKDEALKRIMEREELACTAMGDGIAIPHARLDVGDNPVIAVGRHKAGLDYDSSNRGNVNLIFLVLWKPERPGLFNRLFAGLVSKLINPDFRKSLVEAKNSTEIAKLLSNVKIDMLAGRAAKWEADILITLQLLETKKRAGVKGLEDKILLARDELPGSMLTRFDRLISRYGEALVEASHGVCEGCSIQLSSGLASEMQRTSDSVFICEKCGRFIIHDLS